MKFLIDRLAFRDALQRVEMGIDRKPTRPVLGGVLIEANNDSVVLMTSDLDIAVRYRIDQVQVDQTGWAVIPGRELVDVVKDLESETVTVCLKENDQCELIAGEDTCNLVTMESGLDPAATPEAFPSIPTLDGQPDLTVDKQAFLLMVSSTRFATARVQDNRFATEGVLLEATDGEITLVGTDGRRMARIRRPALTHTSDRQRSVLLPKVLDQISRHGQDEGGDELAIYFLNNLVGFRVGNLESFGRVLDREYPNYANVIPAEGKHVIRAHRESLSKKLRLVSHLTQDSAAVVRLQISADQMGVLAEHEGRGRAEATLEVDYVGEGLTAAFNPAFLLDGLKSAHTDQIELQMEDASRPAKFILGENFDYVVMPLSTVG
ncbi:MAG: DNA polymerase III subunit beta [Planctomycetes bacterium]|nr:DNA polymerase III subunit beta [Planctomycetota bacterium]